MTGATRGLRGAVVAQVRDVSQDALSMDALSVTDGAARVGVNSWT